MWLLRMVLQWKEIKRPSFQIEIFFRVLMSHVIYQIIALNHLALKTSWIKKTNSLTMYIYYPL